MSWQIVVVLQVVAATAVTLYSRYVAVKHKRSFYMVGICVYGMVAAVGMLLAMISLGGALPPLPTQSQALLMMGSGLLIPIQWLLGYRLLAIIGAANSVIASTCGSIVTAVLGIAFLGEPITTHFVLGTLLLMVGTYLAFTVQASLNEKGSVSLSMKTLLLLGATVALAFGLIFEKEAISSMGVWHYSFYGWTAQFLGALVLTMIFGRNELRRPKPALVRDGLALGAIVVTSGALYIYAVSIGTLSGTIMAGSAKVALTVVLAALLLNERNNLGKRTLALVLSLLGLGVVLV